MHALILTLVVATAPCRPPAARPEPLFPWLPRITLSVQDGDAALLWLGWQWPPATPPSAPSALRVQRDAERAGGIDVRLPSEAEALLAREEAAARDAAGRCR
ncbi:MAG: hypothetical protein AABZ30_00500 [Myxococcota bacterium]